MTARPAVLASLLLLPLLALSGAVLPTAGDHVVPLTCPYVTTSPVLDGVIAPGEYGEQFLDADTGLSLHMQHQGNNLSLALVSPGQGWVSVSFLTQGPPTEGDNLVVGYVDAGGRTTVYDLVDHGREIHFDVEVGGTHDILGAMGLKDADSTVIELTVPLNSSDPNDQRFEPGGTYAFRLAYNTTSSYPFDEPTAHTESVTFVVGVPPPTDTVLDLRAGGDGAVAGRLLVLYSLLSTAEGSPVAGRQVVLQHRTTFGWLTADESETDRMGKAEHLLPSVPAGQIEFRAVFPGDSSHAPANTTLSLEVLPAPSWPPILQGWPSQAPLPAVLLAGVVVASVWATYAFVLLQIRQISRSAEGNALRGAGSRNEKKRR